MWRRIFVPMLFGAFAALALLSFFSIAQPAINDWHVFAAGAAVGAGYVLVFSVIAPRRQSKSTGRAVGRGCFFAAAGYAMLILLAVVVASVTGGNFQITGYATLASLLAFGGLGVLGGVMLARFRKSEVERQRAALERQQLELARDLQQRLLPQPLLEAPRYRVTARNVPAQYIAGDFYDFVPLGGGRLLIVLADVAGKGVGAGLIMATVKAMIPLMSAEQPNPAPLLGRLNERIAGQLAAREFIAMLLALYDGERGTVTIGNAGMPDPLLVSTGEPVIVAGARYPVGIRKKLDYESLTVKLPPGERLLLFSDGLPEAPLKGEPLGYDRLGAEVKKAKGEIEPLFAALDAINAGHDDDWTAVLLESR